MSDPAVATGISDLVYESKPAATESDTLDDDLVNAWAVNLGDVPALNRVRNYTLFDFDSSMLLFENYYSELKHLVGGLWGWEEGRVECTTVCEADSQD